MDARTAESRVISGQESWLQRERSSGRFYDRLGWLIAAFLAGMMAFSVWVLRRGAEPGTLLTPPLIALLLIANLLPAIALMVLYSRRVAVRRAEKGGLGSGRLHVRLVALFSALAAVPTVLVAIFASLLFQSGLEFWFSNRARSMLENTVQVAQSTYRYELGRVGGEATAMAGNMAEGLSRVPIDDPRVFQALAAQTYLRSLNEAALLKINAQGEVQTLAVATGSYGSTIDARRIKAAAAKLSSLPENATVDTATPSRVAVLTRLPPGSNIYLYVGRYDPEIAAQIQRSDKVLRDYHTLLERSRANQLKFNAALLLGALVIVGLSILTAMRLADRLVRPVGELVTAAGRIEAGDFTARVPVTASEDEVQTLAAAFNRMTGRLEEQPTALRTANIQLDTRRAFIEAVLSSVTAGVVAVDSALKILLLNRSAENFLEKHQAEIEGQALASVSPELDEFMRG